MTTPVVGAKISSTMPPMITQERKCGRYRSVWDTRLTERLLISLSMIARMMGTGKPISRFMKLSSSVFLSAMEKSRMFNTNLKLSRPTQGLPAMPLNRLYFWKAMMMPTIGL